MRRTPRHATSLALSCGLLCALLSTAAARTKAPPVDAVPRALAPTSPTSPPTTTATAATTATTAAQLLGVLDAEAALVLTFRPRVLWTLDRWLTRLDAPIQGLLAGVRAEAGDTLLRELGVNPLTEAGWTAAGIDANLPVVAGLAALDAEAARRAFDARSRNPRARVRGPYWRSRFAFALSDAGAFRTALATAVAHGTDWALVDGEAARLVATLEPGGKAAHIARLGKQLARARVLAVWRPSPDTLGLLRIEGAIVICDVFSPFASEVLAPRAELPSLLKLLGAPLPDARKSLTTRIRTGAGARLLDADAGVWTTPGGVLALGQGLGRQAVVRAVVGEDLSRTDRRALVAQGASEIARCAELDALPRSLGVKDAAWTLHVTERALSTRVTVALDAASPLPDALPTTDDALTASVPAAAAVVLAYFGTGFAGLRALPRPAILARGSIELTRAVQECGATGFLATALFAWPHLVPLVLDEAPTPVRAVLGSLRNVVVAWRSLAVDGVGANAGVVVGSFAKDANPAIGALLDALDALRAVRKLAGRSFRTWTTIDGMVAFSTEHAGRVAAGLAVGGGKLVDWYWTSAPRAKRAAAPTTGTLATLRVDVGALATPLLPSLDAEVRSLVTPVLRRLGALTGSARVLAAQADAQPALELELTLELK